MVSNLSAKAMRHQRVRARITGTASRPRLSVHISLRHITAQVIDDARGVTLAAVTTVGRESKDSLSKQAAWVGQEIAAVAARAKVKRVVFDRGARLYHSRLSALADAARKHGLEF